MKIEQRVVDSVDLKVRKDLIEAKIYLKLGQIFKDVGLTAKAAEKADEGLWCVNDVIATSMKASLERAVVEEAFSIKWDLLLVKDNLGEAIEVCRTLTQLFPDSTLADRALLRIGQAKMEAGNPEGAIGIFHAVLALPKSDLKAEAQYNIAAIMEKQAIQRAEGSGQEPALADVMVAYKRVADAYPDSQFAGSRPGQDRQLLYFHEGLRPGPRLDGAASSRTTPTRNSSTRCSTSGKSPPIARATTPPRGPRPSSCSPTIPTRSWPRRSARTWR